MTGTGEALGDLGHTHVVAVNAVEKQLAREEILSRDIVGGRCQPFYVPITSSDSHHNMIPKEGKTSILNPG